MVSPELLPSQVRLHSELEPPNAKGTAGGSWFPVHRIYNKPFANLLNRLGERTTSGKLYTARGIYEMIGIKARHSVYSINETPDQHDAAPLRERVIISMAEKAVQRALANKGWSKEDVDAIIVSTSAPLAYDDQIGRSPSKLLKARMGLPWKEKVDGDVFAECASLGWAFDYIFRNPDLYLGKNVIFVASEWITCYGASTNKDRTLFSDGAAALAFTYGEDIEITEASAEIHPDTAHFFNGPAQRSLTDEEAIITFVGVEPSTEEDKGYGKMNGRAVFMWALANLPKLIEKVKEQAKGSSPRTLICHQAIGRMSQFIKEKVLPSYGLSGVYMHENIEYHGNMGSVTMPNAFLEILQNGWKMHAQKMRLRIGDIVSFVGFGAGMSSAVATVKMLR